MFVCGEGLSFDRRGKELMVASWRPWRNLQFLDYSSGGILAEAEPDLQPHYLTSSQNTFNSITMVCLGHPWTKEGTL